MTADIYLEELNVKNMIKLIFVLILVCMGSVYAVETETIAAFGNKTVTNTDVLNEAVKSRWINYVSAHDMEYFLDKIINQLLFEEYAERNGLKITEQEIMAIIEKDAHEHGFATVEQYFQKHKGKNDTDIKDWPTYKIIKEDAQNKKLVEHFEPDTANVTESDIKAYISDYKRFGGMPFGNPEGIKFKSIFFTTDPDNRSEHLREFENIKERLNKGESFDKIADEYESNKVYGISRELSSLWYTRELSKHGSDTLVPWKFLNGKAVIVTWYYNESTLMLLKIENYFPDTRMSIDKAVEDKEMRKVVIERARELKFGKAKNRLIEKLREQEINYTDSKKNICQKLSDDYEAWWIKIYKDSPDFKQNLEKLRKSKLRNQ